MAVVDRVLRSYTRTKTGDNYEKRPVRDHDCSRVKPLIVGNWKNHPDSKNDAVRLFLNLSSGLNEVVDVEVVVAPPVIYLQNLSELSRNIVSVSLGAQNAFVPAEGSDSGSITGESSPKMLFNLGASHLLVGHSDRRQFFGLTDNNVNKTISAALHAGLSPILCVGETAREKRTGHTFNAIGNQVRRALYIPKGAVDVHAFSGLAEVREADRERIVIAYEPVWSFGNVKTPATPEDADEAQAFIRRIIESAWGTEIALKMRILYGGQVTPGNAASFMAMGNIDGVLVDESSLAAGVFTKIVKFGSV